MLDKFDKKSPFKVPENYFENLNKEIMFKLPEKEVKQTKKIQLWRRTLPWSAAVAMFTGVLILLTVTLKSPSNEKAEALPKEHSLNLTPAESDDFYLFIEDMAMQNALYDEKFFNEE